MKITDLVPKGVYADTGMVSDTLAVLYKLLEDNNYDYADEIVERLIDCISQKPTTAPAVEFLIHNILIGKYPRTVEPDQCIGHSLETFRKKMTAHKRKFAPFLKGYSATDIKAAIYGHLGLPIPISVNLARITNTGEYNFMNGVTLASDDEVHFPVGIKVYDDTWFMVNDASTGLMTRVGIDDMEEARVILSNVLSIEDATTIDGLGVWLSIMGRVAPPDSLGRLLSTMDSSYVEEMEDPEVVAKNFSVYMATTTGTQVKPPRLINTKRVKKVSQSKLEEYGLDIAMVVLPEYKIRYEDGTSQRKKIDLRRSMVNRTAEQGIQDSLAIVPLEDSLGAKYPMWLLLNDKAEIRKTKASRVVQVSVAGDMGEEIANLKSIIHQQMRIAMNNKATDKQKSAAMARAQQTARTLMQFRKDAGYFEQNSATKAGIFQNMDSTVLQDDGAEFEKLIAQLADEGNSNE